MKVWKCMEIICCPSYWDGWRQCVADGASGALASLSVALNLLGQDSQVSWLLVVIMILPFWDERHFQCKHGRQALFKYSNILNPGWGSVWFSLLLLAQALAWNWAGAYKHLWIIRLVIISVTRCHHIVCNQSWTTGVGCMIHQWPRTTMSGK